MMRRNNNPNAGITVGPVHFAVLTNTPKSTA